MALLTTTVMMLSACGFGEPEPERDPYAFEDPLPQVDVSQMRLPTSLEGLEVLDPDWATEPKYADGVYLAAGEREGLLEFTAVSVHGEVLWAAQRPASCTGFAVTTDDQGRALAVLTDTETTSDALAGTTATAYDLNSGEHVWGPVEVPGPHHGPGLVFAAPPPEYMGEGGPRVALSPSTGGVAATESDDPQERVIGEYHGIVLLADSEALFARDANKDEELWRIPLSEHGWDSFASSAPLALAPEDGMVLLTTSNDTGALLDIDEGIVISDTTQDAGLDPTTGTLVVLDQEGLHAYDPAHELLWQLAATPGTRIEAVGGVFVYLREQGTVRVHNVVTGAVAEAYDPAGEGPILVPSHLTIDGAGLLLHGRDHLIATIPEPPDTDDQSAP
ncbi:hypothetical protein [Brevibacterium casei]|uniref:Uncharacterized protein n=1 Tax=Brevibacterium casei TaxID=33889 RepID=A0A7T2WPZ7_9MICO|nr:hypothetical protein [Brevibacterium casei]MCT1548994.1 hypothetical protein [Brevibacterium casei]MCT1558939.1 hypothetical protein [Brevibacterium casei]MCT2207204.1 hypothetical protein [Brevibacterium casei]QPR38067.1 hypothetical protein I6G94_10635 [Brevibacterium casei]QPR45356.1 hypothetical protein I6G93_08270 [Brevibacterium casei]